METNKIEIRTLLISMAIVVFLESVSRVLLSIPVNPMIILGAVRAIETILIIVIVLIWGRGMSSIGLTGAGILPGLKKGLIWSAGFGTLCGIAFGVLFAVGINPLSLIHTRLPATHSKILVFFLVGGIVGPIAEEVFFRGILYGFFRRWGAFAAICLSTLAFILAHPVVSGISLPQVIGGIVFAVAYEVEKSLMVPITIHALGNTAIFTLTLLS